MVKGRRKRPQTKNGVVTRSVVSTLQNEELGSPLKKETKLDTNKRTPNNNTANLKSRVIPEVCKSSGCITSFFYSQGSTISGPEVVTNVESILQTEVFFTNEHSSDIQKDIVTEVGHFRTDETPVAVPIHGPSTPHRINMPSNQSDDSDEPVVPVEPPAKLISTPVIVKKTSCRGRRKNVGPAINQRLGEQAVQNTNHKLTDYFPVRRSVRKSKKAVLEEKQRDMENKVLCQVEDGLAVQHFPGKGRGVVTTREFAKGEFVVEYIGDRIDQVEAKKREKIYAQDQNTGCYMYYFQHRNRQYCVDATKETDKLGRLVNHSRNGNLIARVVEVESTPHLVLTAKEDIPIGVEVTYDYGDRSREAIRHHPWLAL